MSNTYLSLCQKFRKLVGISGSGPTAVTGQTGMNEKITIWIADADMFIQRKWDDWKFLFKSKVEFTATANTKEFTLDDLSITDLARWKINGFIANPGTALAELLSSNMTYQEYLMSPRYISEEVISDITHVMIRDEDDAVIFYPTPEENTTIWGSYWQIPTRMTANASVSPIPIRYEDTILNRAKMDYAEHYEDMALYQVAEKAFEDAMQRLESNQLPGRESTRMSSNDEYQDIVVE